MKKNTLKRAICIVLSLVMVLGILVGCDNTDVPPATTDTPNQNQTTPPTQTTAPKAYEYQTGITLTLSGRTGTTTDWGGTDLVAMIKDMFGITLECDPQANDIWDTKWNLMMAEDEVPDIVTAITPTKAQVSQWGADGYLLPIDEYLEHMPNLVAFDQSHPGYLDACRSPDGHIYGLFKYNESVAGTVYRAWIREDWLNNLGLKYPTTVDELYDVLVAFKEKDANGNGDPSDEIPMGWSDKYSRKPLSDLLAAFGLYTEKNTAAPYFILEVDDNGTVRLSDTTENYKAFLTYMHKLWEEGLVNDTAYSITNQELQALIKENKVGIYAYGTALGAPDDKNPDVELEWFTGLTSEYNDTPSTGSTSLIANTAKIVLGADTEYPAEVCRMIDWFYTVEGAFLTRNINEDLYPGIQIYDEVTVAGYEQFPIRSITKTTPAPEGWEDWNQYKLQKCYINEGFDVFNTITEGTAEYAMVNGSQDPADLEKFCEANVSGYLANIYKRLNSVEVVFGYPTLDYSEAVATERTALVTDIKLYCQTAQAQFINGELDIEADWDTFIKTLNEMGLPRLLEIEQEAYDAMYK